MVYKEMFRNNHILRFSFPTDKFFDEDGSPKFELHRKIYVEVVDATDNLIIDEIVRCAKENGISDLYLLDKEFIVSALQHEVERRRENASS